MKLQPRHAPAQIKKDDTAIIMASNRLFQDTAFRFLPDASVGGIRYFVVYSHDGFWDVIPIDDLKTAIAYLPEKNKDWVIYTEGMGKLFTSAADRAMRMSAQYRVNVIMLDYPSIHAKWRRTRNYYFSKHYAGIAYKDFAPVIDTVKVLKATNQLGTGSVNLFFHSMGNIVLEKMVLNNKIQFLNQSKWVDNLVLNAPCVRQRHHARWMNQVNFAERIYVLYNPQDFTLGGAYFMSKWNQLGMKVKRPLAEKATYINFEKLAGKRHSNFLNLRGYPAQPEAAINIYSKLLHGEKVNVRDTVLYKISDYKKIGWDILP
ncbi:MAG TPA: alpha/beta hydrolase [Flavipsychrobacter sp.]|nr:alpha/beta hydrolase [Flavipsychrobacter sp.]